MDNRKCFNCGKTGHLKRDCPSGNSKRDHSMKNIKCFGCGRHGHFLKDCTSSAAGETSSALCESTENKSCRKKVFYPECTTKFIDTHCHLEYVFERMRHTGTFEDFKSRNTFPNLFEGCVTTFCDPTAFSAFGLWEELLSQDGIWGTFGCHPHNAKYYNENLELKIIQCLEHPKAVALGEIGLDYSKRAQSNPEIQREVFTKQANWAVSLGKPLVIHCRDAEDDTLRILQQSVPTHWKIHMHCFTGSITHALKFLEMFRNLYIGITGVVTFSKADETHELAFDVPLERLLIETDAPYFVPTDVASNNKWSHPGMVIFVAKKIAEIKQCSIDEVLEAARVNTKAVYGI